jgi:hypothetical protein
MHIQIYELYNCNYIFNFHNDISDDKGTKTESFDQEFTGFYLTLFVN